MKERDKAVARYRDAVLVAGIRAPMSPEETAAACVAVNGHEAQALLKFGLFVMDDGSGSILAIPRSRACLKSMKDALENAGLRIVARRLARAARSSGLKT
jgi:hypothetical protein